jgi:DNA-binding MarR family transcriptional regulator
MPFARAFGLIIAGSMGQPKATDEPATITEDLYALVVYLHVSCNRDLLTAIGREELSFNQLQLLERLRAGRRRPTITQAASILHVTIAAASRMVDSLARRGLVHRETDDDNYRAKRIVITDRGEQVIARLHAARLDGVAAFTERLKAGERDQLHAALRPVLEREHITAYHPPAAAA